VIKWRGALIPQEAPALSLTCPVCAKSFEPNHPLHQYCTPKCRTAAFIELRRRRRQAQKTAGRPCAFCAFPFTPRRRDKKFCTDECRQAHSRAEHARRQGRPYRVRTAHRDLKLRVREMVFSGFALESLGFSPDEVGALLEQVLNTKP
jgi:hypothetical protein